MDFTHGDERWSFTVQLDGIFLIVSMKQIAATIPLRLLYANLLVTIACSAVITSLHFRMQKRIKIYE